MYVILDKINKIAKEEKLEIEAKKYCDKRPYLRYEKLEKNINTEVRNDLPF